MGTLPQGLRVKGASQFENFDILTTGNAMRCILSQSKGGNRKKFSVRFARRGASIHNFAPGPRKALGGPG